MQRFKKSLLAFFSTFLFIIIIIILFFSSILHHLIEKYDTKYTGREITLNTLYVNPFTGSIHISGLKIYEQGSDSLFFSSRNVDANISMFKLFAKTIEIENIILDHPVGRIIKDQKKLNFTDLIERYSSNDSLPVRKKSSLHFNIFNIKIIEGEVHYREANTPINYFIKQIAIESFGKKWDSDTLAAKISFLSGIGKGDLNGDMTINVKTLDYHFAATAHKFDLKIVEQYLSVLVNYGSFKANVDANLKATGNFHDKEAIDAKGLLVVNDFHFGKDSLTDYSSFDKFILFVNELNPKKHIYLIDSASLQHPYFKYERYDGKLDNIQTMFGKDGANLTDEKFNLVIEIAKYVKVLAKNFFKSNYKVNRLAVYNGCFTYNDYTLGEMFTTGVDPIFAAADSINKNNHWAKACFKTGIKPYGNATVTVDINPKDSSDFDVTYAISGLAAAMFNPYLIAYTSYPMDKGTVGVTGSWNVRSNIISSKNHLVITDPRITKRSTGEDARWIPLPLIMSLVRERGNSIDYEIPITGNLKSPKFHLKDVFTDLLQNILIKPPTTPYNLKVETIETDIENSFALKWEMCNGAVMPNQEKFISKMATFLAGNPDATISVYPMHYTSKEQELLLLFEAKKKYFLSVNHKTAGSFSETDSIDVYDMSIKDPLFVSYLNANTTGTLLFTVQDKCAQMIDSSVVTLQLNQLNKERLKAFILYFKEKGVENQVKIFPGKNTIPYNGFSFYKIEYKEGFPPFLLRAYRQMDQLNERF